VRARLSWLYGTLFLVSGAVLLAVTAALWGNGSGGTILAFSNVPGQILHVAGVDATTGGGAVGVSGGPGAVTVGPPPDHLPPNVDGAVTPVTGKQVEPFVPPKGAVAQRQFVVGQLRTLATEQHNSDLHNLLLYSALALALMAIVSIVLGWWTAGRVLRPLRTITNTARDISATNLHRRLDLDGPQDELKELGDTFDQLLARLERSFQSQRQFVANASHELRTPLATMRAALDVAEAKPDPAPQTVRLADLLRQELDQVDKLLDSFLSLARAQAGSGDNDRPVSLDWLVASAIEGHERAIDDRHLTVHDNRCPRAVVSGNEALLARLVGNLVDNAVRHNQPGGWVLVRIGVDAGTARLVVENGGSVLDDETVRNLVQPFRRLGADRTGSDTGFGLGLSIVDAIADAHGGRLTLHARDGGGLRALVELPLADRAEAAEEAVRVGVPV